MEMKPQAIKIKISPKGFNQRLIALWWRPAFGWKIKMESFGIKNKSQSVEPSIQYRNSKKAGITGTALG
jgi:hypothetical protein